MNKNNLTKNLLTWFLMVLCGVGILVLMLAAKSLSNWSSSLMPARSIVVEGEGKAILISNIATISFSVVSEGKEVVGLQNDNNQKINRAIDFVKKQNINSKDIQTANYNLSPKYIYNPKNGRSTIDGYVLTQTVSVKIRDLDKVGDVLGGLPPLGINEINGPNFSVDDIDKFLNEARAQAFRAAVDKAQLLSSLAGVRLGRVITFNENRNQPPIYAMRAMEMGVGRVAPTPQIESGSEEVKVMMNVTYEIR